MCNPAWHPLWAVVGKPGRVAPAAVFGIVSALLADDPILAGLDDKGRVAVLAEWSGLKTIQVALVLAGLEARGVVAEGRITREWQDVLRPSERLKTRLNAQDADEDDRRRALRSARNRRYYLRSRGREAEIETAQGAPIKTLPASESDAPFLEEKEQDQLFPSGAREAIRPAQGWGMQAEADKHARAQKWLQNTLKAAQDMMSFDDFRKLYVAAYADPRPRWAQQQLDEISRRAKEQAPPKQRWMPLPLPGGGTASQQAMPERRAAHG